MCEFIKDRWFNGHVWCLFGYAGAPEEKIAAPELVQEATGEIVGIRFHSKERFGHPNSTCLQPAENHDCWKRGWVRCEYLPVHVEVRFDGLSEDYTGLNKPGVWHVEPVEDAWKLL